jgi:hypothetical protein
MNKNSLWALCLKWLTSSCEESALARTRLFICRNPQFGPWGSSGPSMLLKMDRCNKYGDRWPAPDPHEGRITGVLPRTDKLCGLWSSRLWSCVIFMKDTDVSEEHAASIFRVEVYGLRNRLEYVCTSRLQGRWSLRSTGVRRNPRRGLFRTANRNAAFSGGYSSVS